MKAKLVFAVAVALCVTATDAYGDIFAADARGNFSASGTTNSPGGGATPDNSYEAWNGGSNFRNFFAFDRSQWAGNWVVSGSFRIQNRTGSASPTLGLWDFTGSQSDLLSGAPANGVANWTDLGSGTSYGSGAVPTNALTTIALNAAAINNLRTGSGTYFIIGGSITAPSNNLAFFGTGAGDQTELDLVLQANTAPVAVPGGPYQIDPLMDLFMDGSGSFDPDEALGDSIVSWEWDVDGDGTYDFSGETYNATWAELVGVGIAAGNTYDLALRVTDSMGLTNVQTTSFTVNPVPEPATCIIWALAGGSCGLVSLRRRRKAQAAA